MDYFSAINAIPSVGQGLGDLLLFLNQVTGASLQSMHVMGFSLGAHVAGNAGRRMDGRIGRVTGAYCSTILQNYTQNTSSMQYKFHDTYS